MKFILAVLILIGITESSSCASNKLGLKLGYENQQKGTLRENIFKQGSNTGYYCLPVIGPVKPASQPTKVTITVTPHNTFVPVSMPSYSYPQSSYFPTIDFYPWANNVPTFSSQSTISSTTTPIISNNQQIPPIYTTPITQPTPILPYTTIQPVQPPANTYVIAPPTPINFVSEQPTKNLQNPEIRPLSPNFSIPSTLPIQPIVTLPSEYNGFIFAENQPNQSLNIIQSSELKTPERSQTIPLTTNFSNLNFDDIDFSTINLDDLFAANNLPLGQ